MSGASLAGEGRCLRGGREPVRTKPVKVRWDVPAGPDALDDLLAEVTALWRSGGREDGMPDCAVSWGRSLAVSELRMSVP